MTNHRNSVAHSSWILRYFLPGATATLLLAALAWAVPDARQSGGEPDGIVQVANLVYAGTKSSHCFSDHFLTKAEKETSISTSRRFHAVKLSSEDIYEFPLVIMTGEGDFQLSEAERENLRRYVERGGFLLASASCSSTEWDRAFRREMATIFPSHPLQVLDLSHPLFHMAYDIKDLRRPAAPGGSQHRRPAGSGLLAGRSERHPPHQRLLLLRRQRTRQRDRNQREYSGLRTNALKGGRDGKPAVGRFPPAAPRPRGVEVKNDNSRS